MPLGRRDECPSCLAELHVCRMCRMYDPREPTGCAEEDALEVREKERANFCDYFKADPHAHAPGVMEAHVRAETELAALFGRDPPESSDTEPDGGSSATTEDDDALSRAEDLFKP